MEARDRILSAATELLLEKPVVSQVTVREIAERAGVGLGLINYHFKSKDALLKEAYDRMFLIRVQEWLDDRQTGALDPLDRLKGLVRTSAEISMDNLSLMQMSLSYELAHSGMETHLMILPLLRSIYQGEKDELSLRMIAMALISTLQAILVKKDAFEAYMGVDLDDPNQRASMLDLLFAQIIRKENGDNLK